MADHTGPNATDLQELSNAHDRAVDDIGVLAGAPMIPGPPNQATSAAVAEGNRLIEALGAEFASSLTARSAQIRQSAGALSRRDPSVVPQRDAHDHKPGGGWS
ncbi:hypothetical protein [Mycobacterium sp. SMC-17]|uniref:hypothetical protein n=1 Tax=Mycobacterium sp. SMC-17 TaxID=3381628 RepID=UPI0038762474